MEDLDHDTTGLDRELSELATQAADMAKFGYNPEHSDVIDVLKEGQVFSPPALRPERATYSRRWVLGSWETGDEHQTEHWVKIFGEPFRIEEEDGRIRLTHNQWSLIGSGDTLLEAEIDLFKCARRLAPAYLDHPVEDMTNEATRMRDFIAKVMTHAVR